MPKLRIVHVSDIHFGQEIDGTLTIQDAVRDGLIRDCSTMQAQLGNANGIVVTGDVAYAGKKAEYDKAGEWLDRLCGAVKCKPQAVHTIPGNHDVDLAKIDYTVELLHNSLRECHSDDVDNTLSKIIGKESDGVSTGAAALFSKFAAYREFASRYQSDFESLARPISVKEIKFASGHILRFLVMTSVYVSDRADAPRKMVLGSKQYVLPEEENVEWVLMCHHPLLEWFKDRHQATPWVRNRGRVILAGHEHHPAFRKVEENGKEYLMVDAGAANPPGSEKRSPHCYNWIEFDVREKAGAFSLDVTVHPRIWMPEKTEFWPDRERIDGATSLTYSVRCHNYKPIVAEAAAPAATGTPIHVGVGDAEAVVMPDDERFAKLMYYFWRYLDWQQRYGVLAKADVWPKGLDRPMPQVLEHNALSTARDQDKLAAIWDEVMTYVPEPQREPNPF